MSSVDGESARLTVPLATAATEARPQRRAADGAPPPTVDAPATTDAAAASAAPRELLPEAPGGGLAALRDQARAAQAQLAHQPLQITNSNSRLILKLFGG